MTKKFFKTSGTFAGNIWVAAASGDGVYVASGVTLTDTNTSSSGLLDGYGGGTAQTRGRRQRGPV